jgi:hypothetical protein
MSSPRTRVANRRALTPMRCADSSCSAAHHTWHKKAQKGDETNEAPRRAP